jgi:hypothetical protein
MDILAHPTDPTMMAWFTTARGDDLDDTLERAAHQALTEFFRKYNIGKVQGVNCKITRARDFSEFLEFSF